MTDDRERFELGGINHLALVCRDMARTVDFYTNVLGMPLVKTIELPAGMGQHFFFDAGGGDCIAFFWFPEAPPPAPGVASAPALPDEGEITSAVGSMNHVALDVPAERIEEYRDRLVARGVECSTILNHVLLAAPRDHHRTPRCQNPVRRGRRGGRRRPRRPRPCPRG